MPQTDEPLTITEARRDHLPSLVAMLQDDFLGQGREELSSDALTSYAAGFDAVQADPNNQLYVALDGAGEPVGMFQLTFIPGLSYMGVLRGQIEGVRTRTDRRGRGVGAEMMRFAIEASRERGCALVQLTTNKERADAHRFYKRLGFEASHEGMKLRL